MSHSQIPAINSLSTYTPEPTDNQTNKAQEKDVSQLFRETITPDSAPWIYRTNKKKGLSLSNTPIIASPREGFNSLNSMIIGKSLLQDLFDNRSNLPPEILTNLRFELVKKTPRVFNEDLLILIKCQKNDSVISKNQALINQCKDNIKKLTEPNKNATATNVNNSVLRKIRVSTLQIFLKNCKRDAVDQEALNYFEKEIVPLYNNRTDLLQVDVNAKHLQEIMKHRKDKKIAISTYSKIGKEIREDLKDLLKQNNSIENPVKETISQTPVEIQNPIASSIHPLHPLTQPSTTQSNKRSIEQVSPQKPTEIDTLKVMRVANILNPQIDSMELDSDKLERDAISILSTLPTRRS